MLPVALRVSALLAGSWAAVSFPQAALAQPAASSRVAAPSGPITVEFELLPGSSLDADRLRHAIARELGALVVREPGAPGGTLVVRQAADSVTVSFDGPGGRHDARTIPLAGDAAQAEGDIALVAVNVARDQTAAFLQPVREQAPAVDASPGPRDPAAAATPSPSSPCERVAAPVKSRAPIGVDFVPFAGTSSFDGGRSVRNVSVGALGAISSGIDGVAVSGLANVDPGPVCGAEIAGLVNVATGVQGAQIAGLVDVAGGDSMGLQLSLVNVASGRLRGAQIGLVNVADDADAQVGLVNIDVHGRLRLDAWTKAESGMVLAGVKHGPAHSHWIYAFEMNAVSGRPWGVLGVGGHVTPAERLYVDFDLLFHVQLVPTTTSPNQLSEIRAVVGYGFAPRLSVFVGPTFNVLVASNLSRADAPGFAWGPAQPDPSSVAVRMWPGVVAGVEGL
jgi:hypothetical protein